MSSASAILLHGWWQLRNQRSWGSLLALPLLALSGAAIVMLLWPRSTPIVAGWVAAMTLTSMWVWLVGSVLTQNRPSTAHLVPGQCRRLQAMLIGGSYLFASLAWLLLSWVPLAGGTLACCIVGALLGLAWLMAEPRLGLACFAVYSLSVFTEHRWWSETARQVTDMGPLAYVLAVLALGVGLLPVVGRGGAAHAARFARHKRQLDIQRQFWSSDSSLAWTSGSALAFWQQRTSGVLDAYLRWRLRYPQSARPIALLPLVLLRPLLWPQQLATVLGLGLLSSLYFGWIFLSGQWELVQSHAFVLAGFGQMAFLSWTGVLVRTRFQDTRSEQSLLLLLPSLPRGAALAQAWGVEALRVALRSWTAVAAVVLAATALLAPQHLLMSALVSVLQLPWVMLLLRSPAQRLATLGWSVLYGASLFAQLGLMAWQPPWLQWLMLLPLAALPMGAWMLHRLRGAREPFPAGRL